MATRPILITATVLFLIVGGYFWAGDSSDEHHEDVVISCGAVGNELELCRSGASEWARKTGHSVRVVVAPVNSSDRLTQYQLLLAAKSPDIDLFAIDSTWPGIMGGFFIDLKKEVSSDVLGQHFESFIENNTFQGQVVAFPWFIDAGVLFYRKDLLRKYREAVPETWDELERIARRIQEAERRLGNARMWGFVFQGRAYEGLTCNALEWIYSHGGGTILDTSGAVTVANPAAARALQKVAQWVGEITPPGVLNYMEEESRGVFQSGNAVFLRNWPYVWRLSQSGDSPVRGKVGMAVLPKGEVEGIHTGTLGGWSLAVSKYSKRKKAAIALAVYLTGHREQKRRALEGGLHPTIESLYRDPDLVAENPALEMFYQAFQRAVPRPSHVAGIKYGRVSTEFWEAVHDILTGKATAQSRLKELEITLKRIGRNGRW